MTLDSSHEDTQDSTASLGLLLVRVSARAKQYLSRSLFPLFGEMRVGVELNPILRDDRSQIGR